METNEEEKDLYHLTKQRDRAGKDVQVIKERDGNILTSEECVLRRWKDFFEELMIEYNERGKKGGGDGN